MAAPSTALSRGEPSAPQLAFLQPFQQYGGAYSFGGFTESPHPSTIPTSWEESSFPGLVPPSGTGNFESVVGIKPGGLGVVIGYMVDDLLTPCLQNSFLLIHTFILGSSVRCNPLPTFHLNQGVRTIHFYTKQLQTINRAWIPSSLIPLRHQNWIHPWMSLMSLILQSHQGFSTQLILFLIFLNHSLLLALGLLNYGARLGHLFHLCFLATKMSASELICYFSSYPVAIWVPVFNTTR